jgi:hypothetical protein
VNARSEQSDCNVRHASRVDRADTIHHAARQARGGTLNRHRVLASLLEGVGERERARARTLSETHPIVGKNQSIQPKARQWSLLRYRSHRGLQWCWSLHTPPAPRHLRFPTATENIRRRPSRRMPLVYQNSSQRRDWDAILVTHNDQRSAPRRTANTITGVSSVRRKLAAPQTRRRRRPSRRVSVRARSQSSGQTRRCRSTAATIPAPQLFPATVSYGLGARAGGSFARSRETSTC